MIIYVDAGCSGNPGKVYYRGVDEEGTIIFYRTFPWGTNNLGEFLALCTGVAYLLEKNEGKGIVWSDSKTAIAWFRKNKINSTMLRNDQNREIFERIDKAIAYFGKTNGQVGHYAKVKTKWWNTKEKGEIPADYGLKR